MGSNAWFSGDKSTLDKCSAVSYHPEMEKAGAQGKVHNILQRTEETTNYHLGLQEQTSRVDHGLDI